MAVRNFWIEANIDGRQTELKGGPMRKDGGMQIRIYQRDHGAIEKTVRIVCEANGDVLDTLIFIGGQFAGKFSTKR